MLPAQPIPCLNALLTPSYKRQAIFSLIGEILTHLMVGASSLLQLIVPIPLLQ